MTDQPELFAVEEILSPRLKWMKDHGILTHWADVEECPWLAIQKMPGHTGTIGEIMAEYCVLYDDHGYCGYGATETEAITNLARSRRIPLWNETQQEDRA
jgi:hypothetical protein